MKKTLSIIITLMLCFSMCVCAFAVTPQPGTPPTGYKAYKIFDGFQGTNTTDLKDIVWGNGINPEAFLQALKDDATYGSSFTACNTAYDVAEVLMNEEDGSDLAMFFAKTAYANKNGDGKDVVNGETSIDAGYYLVVDETVFDEEATGTVRGLALLQQTKKGTFDIVPKVEAPTVEKKVKDINNSAETEFSAWQDSADHDIGDQIPFLLKATLKEITPFDKYELVFVDTGCAGLAPIESTFELYIDDTKVTTANAFKTTVTDNDFTVTIADVKALGAKDNSVVSVEYKATLTNEAQIGSLGNPNEVYLKYSNNPNFTGPYDEETGTTPETELGKTINDKVIVFTYKVDVTKYARLDESTKQALSGAKFKLYKKTSADGKTTVEGTEYEGTWTPVGSEVTGTGENGNLFTWKGIDDGEYIIAETVVPNGYARMNNTQFTVSAEHDEESDDPQLTKLEGGDLFEGTVGTGSLAADIENVAKGAVLPETGGIGTKIFYIVGGIMLAGAAILLITKKRMNSEKC